MKVIEKKNLVLSRILLGNHRKSFLSPNSATVVQHEKHSFGVGEVVGSILGP